MSGAWLEGCALEPRPEVANAVGDLIWHGLSAAKPKTRYAILRHPFRDRLLPRLLGPRFVDRVIARRLGFPKAP